MKKHHLKSLKFHTVFSLILVALCIGVIILKPSWMLAVSCSLLVAYVAGNGIIHAKKNQLTGDSLFEYVIVALIAGLVIAGAALH